MKIFHLPDLGEGLAEAEIREWYVKVGDEVKVDQPLVSMETAKAVVDVPSPYTGKITQLHGKENDIIQTGSPLISLSTEMPLYPRVAFVRSTPIRFLGVNFLILISLRSALAISIEIFLFSNTPSSFILKSTVNNCLLNSLFLSAIVFSQSNGKYLFAAAAKIISFALSKDLSSVWLNKIFNLSL